LQSSSYCFFSFSCVMVMPLIPYLIVLHDPAMPGLLLA
jgi:hypothetical protein